MFKIHLQCQRWKLRKLKTFYKVQNSYFTSTKYFAKKTPTNLSHENGFGGERRGFIPFLQGINLRRVEAKRSVLVQVQSAQSCTELNSYCNIFGTVKQMFHYSHFILVEFAEESDVDNLLRNSSYVDETLVVPTYSHFLWFKAPNKKSPKLKQINATTLSAEDGTRVLNDSEIKDSLSKCENVSEQMRMLHLLTRLNDLGSRLRYLTALQIENMISGMFPHTQAYPFGSSVNGYGKMGCDLDLVLRLVDKTSSDNNRLMFHCKASSGSERSTNQRHIEAFGDMIHLFLPGCAQVRKIIQARIPIVKYQQKLTDVECDLSMGNMSGVYMSDFLYLMGEIDQRVKPLVFTVRKWAESVGLTNSSPGRWITNFSLTLMVLGFLQRPLSGKPILPSLNTLVKLAGKKDVYTTEDGINCTFLRDINKYTEHTTNTDSLETLLREFFQYYSQFDFSTKAVCLNEALSLTKPEFSPLYIINPLERGLNVSKNVSAEEVDRLKTEVRNALWALESQESSVGNWGLLAIFENKKRPHMHANLVSKNRLMNVSALFDAEYDGETVVEYKNTTVKKQVANIKRNTKEKISNVMKQQKSHRIRWTLFLGCPTIWDVFWFAS
nr:unnamed protein product [Callosobruchus chinensis]